MTNDQAYIRLAMRIFADFGVSTAVPAVLAALGGKWLDARYGTAPKLLIACLAAALALTALTIVRKARRYSAEYQRLIASESKAPPSPES
ncbi:AtpZ/AtpI family protein [Patescibacteria group bacterium]|nr:MAG: AtpZ/AtpI family protein [Patescibacteria group bacterium]